MVETAPKISRSPSASNGRLMRLSFPTLQELQSVHAALAWLLARPDKKDGDILAAAHASGLVLSNEGPDWKVDGDMATRLAEAGLTRLPSDPDRFGEICTVWEKWLPTAMRRHYQRCS